MGRVKGPLQGRGVKRRTLRFYGDPVLREKGRPVPGVTPELLGLVEDMKRVMAEADGLGLAAHQVGEPLNLVIILLEDTEGVPADLAEEDKYLVLVNPKVVSVSEEEIVDEEGCLSFPGLYLDLPRPKRAAVRGERLLGERLVPVEFEAEDLFARAVLHETDHLKGVLFIDYLTPFQRMRALARWKRQLLKSLKESEG